MATSKPIPSVYPFYIVEFTGREEVAIVAGIWLNGKKTQTRWPPSFLNPTRLAKKQSDYDETWELHDIKILGKFHDHDSAVKKLNKSTMTSDLSSSTDSSQSKRKSRKRNVSSDDDQSTEEGEVPVKTPKTAKKLEKFSAKRKRSRSISPEQVDHNDLALSSPRPRPNQFSPTHTHGPRNQSFHPNSETPSSTRSHFHSSQEVYQHTQNSVYEKDLQDIKRVLEKINLRLKDYGEKFLELGQLINSLSARGEPESDCPTFKLPINSLDDLEAVEQLLLENPGSRTWLKRKLDRVGGSTLTEGAALRLKKLLGRNIGSQYSLAGHMGNENFSALQLFVIVRDSLLDSFEGCTEQSVRTPIGSGLKHFKDKLEKSKKDDENYLTTEGEGRQKRLPGTQNNGTSRNCKTAQQQQRENEYSPSPSESEED